MRRYFHRWSWRWIGWRAHPVGYCCDRFPQGDVYRLWFAGFLFKLMLRKTKHAPPYRIPKL